MTDVLLVKMSSLGDVVHALPALTDAQRARPEVRFDWVVEEAFVPIARLMEETGAYAAQPAMSADVAAFLKGDDEMRNAGRG